MPQVDVTPLFPIPFMRVTELLPAALVRDCVEQLKASTTRTNAKSDLLSHTDIDGLEGSDLYPRIGALVAPHLAQFGELLFGEKLEWSIKEIWSNVLEPGGHQSVHAHSNSFISGIVYLTESDPSARTVFHRSLGGTEFVFSNDNPNAKMGPFNGNKWVSPQVLPGDMVLYPSYLLHEVPVNQGLQRMTIAFNAIPDRLDTWGYSIHFDSRRSERR
ncbi:MAG: putative 2OG-Fe(II) oxygenase [Pseudomonadota bacterium]